MATIKLTKVTIGANRYYATFTRPDTTQVTVQITATDYANIHASTNPEVQTLLQTASWKSSVSNIAFETTSGNLADKQYATQANGFHWVKIPGYKMAKIASSFITNNTLSQAGIDEVIKRSEVE